MTADYSRELEIAKTLASEAGKIMLQYFDGDQQIEIKDDGSPVTIGDKQINTFVIARLKEAFPDDGIVGEEESTDNYGMGRKWLCDPIDGTRAYTWGLPSAMFSLALVVDGRPQVGVAYDPFLDRLYTGIVGQGSYCNGQKLAVSDSAMPGATIAVTGNLQNIINEPDYIKAITDTGAGLASFDGGVYKSTLVARGRLPGYIGKGSGPYDIAAAEVIVVEAGGKVTGLDGKQLDYAKDFQGVLVTNGIIHDQLVAVLSR